MSYPLQSPHEHLTIATSPENRYGLRHKFGVEYLYRTSILGENTSMVVIDRFCGTPTDTFGKQNLLSRPESDPRWKKKRLTGSDIGNDSSCIGENYCRSVLPWVIQKVNRRFGHDTTERQDAAELQIRPNSSPVNICENGGERDWVSEKLGTGIRQQNTCHINGEVSTDTEVLREFEKSFRSSSHALELDNEMHNCPTQNTIYIAGGEPVDCFEYVGGEKEIQSGEQSEPSLTEQGLEWQPHERSHYRIQESDTRGMDEHDSTSYQQKNLPFIHPAENISEFQLACKYNQEPKDESAAQLLYQVSEEQPITRCTDPKASGSGQQHSDQQCKNNVSKFHRFVELPIEVRLMVWKEFLRSEPPRTLVMYCETIAQEHWSAERIKQVKDPPATTLEEFYSVSQAESPLDWPWRLRTAECSIPAMLHTTKESRGVAETCYKRMFSHQLGGKPVWFDDNRDWLLMDSGAAFDLLMRGIRNGPKDRRKRMKFKSKIQRLALGNLSPTDVIELCDRVPNFRCLQFLYLEKTFPEWKDWEDYFFARVRLEIRARTSQPTITAMNTRDFSTALSILGKDSEGRPTLRNPPRKKQAYPPLSLDIQEERQLAKTAFLNDIRMVNTQRILTLNPKQSLEGFL